MTASAPDPRDIEIDGTRDRLKRGHVPWKVFRAGPGVGRFPRYVAAGVFNTVFGYGVFAALELQAGKFLPYLVVLLIAHVVGVLEAFLIQRRFVFGVADRWLPQLLRFWSVYLVALAVNLVLLPVCVEVFGMPVLIAQLLVLGALALGTFAVHSAFTFAPTASR